MERSEFIKRCAEKEIYAYGTAYIFESRSRSLRFRLRILSFLSLTVPLSVGAIAMVAADAKLLPVIVTLSGLLSIPLFVLTLWSHVSYSRPAQGRSARGNDVRLVMYPAFRCQDVLRIRKGVPI